MSPLIHAILFILLNSDPKQIAKEKHSLIIHTQISKIKKCINIINTNRKNQGNTFHIEKRLTKPNDKSEQTIV